MLRCHEHTSLLDQWKLTAEQIELVGKAGFHYLRMIPAINFDSALIAALVERWRRETNTFHLPVGEMTITLEDVALLLGLAIDGEPVIGVTSSTPSLLCEKLLGRVPEDLTGGMVKLTWLKEFFSQRPKDAPVEEIECRTRAYLLYLVGSTYFPQQLVTKSLSCTFHCLRILTKRESLHGVQQHWHSYIEHLAMLH